MRHTSPEFGYTRAPTLKVRSDAFLVTSWVQVFEERGRCVPLDTYSLHTSKFLPLCALRNVLAAWLWNQDELISDSRKHPDEAGRTLDEAIVVGRSGVTRIMLQCDMRPRGTWCYLSASPTHMLLFAALKSANKGRRWAKTVPSQEIPRNLPVTLPTLIDPTLFFKLLASSFMTQKNVRPSCFKIAT